jgi:hypothetical protein
MNREKSEVTTPSYYNAVNMDSAMVWRIKKAEFDAFDAVYSSFGQKQMTAYSKLRNAGDCAVVLGAELGLYSVKSIHRESLGVNCMLAATRSCSPFQNCFQIVAIRLHRKINHERQAIPRS